MATIHIFVAVTGDGGRPEVQAVLVQKGQEDDALGDSDVQFHWDTGNGYQDGDNRPVEPVDDPTTPPEATQLPA